MSNTSEGYCRSCTDTVHLVQGKRKIWSWMPDSRKSLMSYEEYRRGNAGR
jgi:hypothetical protein